MVEKKYIKFGKSKKGNFYPIDETCSPHIYMITEKHLEKNEGYVLDIEKAEENGAVCGICKEGVRKGIIQKPLKYHEHEKVLLLNCLKDFKEDEFKQELQEYINKIKKTMEKENYKGVGFIKGF